MPNSKDLGKEQAPADETSETVPSDDDPSGEFVDAEGGQEEPSEVLSCDEEEEYRDVASAADDDGHDKISDGEETIEDESSDDEEDDEERDGEEDEADEDEDQPAEEKDVEKCKDENESEDSKTDAKKEEDRRNPQYIPKKGTFYEHDDRILAAGEKPEVTQEPEDEEVEKEKKIEIATAKPKKIKQKKTRSEDGRWGHDMFNVDEQKPKPKEEIISAYGYDIRNEDGPPKARRRRKYGRGPKQYTANWKEQDNYTQSAQDRRRNRPRPSRPRDKRENLNGRPRDDRDRDTRPRDDRIRDDSTRDDRFREDRTRDERIRDDRSREEKKRDDGPREERYKHDRIREERSRDDRPRNERIRDDRLREERPRDLSPKKGQSSAFVKTIVFKNRSFKDRRPPSIRNDDQRRVDDRRRYRDDKPDLESRMGKLSLDRHRSFDREPINFIRSSPVGHSLESRGPRDNRDRGHKSYHRDGQHPQSSINNPSTKRYSSLRREQQEQKVVQVGQKSTSKELIPVDDTNQYQPPAQLPVNQRPQQGANNHYFPAQSGTANRNYYPETRSPQSSYNFMPPNGIDQSRFPQLPQRQFMPSTGPPPPIAEPRFMSQPVSATAPPPAPRALQQVIPGPPGAAYPQFPGPPAYPPGYPQFPPPPAAAAASFNMNPLNPLTSDLYGGVTYYDTITQQVSPRLLPQRRPKNALPIIPPPGPSEVDSDITQGVETIT